MPSPALVDPSKVTAGRPAIVTCARSPSSFVPATLVAKNCSAPLRISSMRSPILAAVTSWGDSSTPTAIPVTPGSGAMTTSALPGSELVSRSSQSPGYVNE